MPVYQSILNLAGKPVTIVGNLLQAALGPSSLYTLFNNSTMPGQQQLPLRKAFMRHWFAIEAIPIYIIIGGVVGGATWYLGRLALGPTVVWTRSNPTPWNSITPEQNTKLLTINQKFDKNWSRDKL